MIDAVIRAGGKQYRVHEGSVLDVATMDAAAGSSVELRDVLLVSEDGQVTVGEPNVPDAVVVAEVVEHGKGRKVINFKFKAKTRYRRKRGHRQGYTKLEVREIRIGSPKAKAAAPKRKSRAKPKAEPEAEAPAQEAENVEIESVEAETAKATFE